MSQSIRVSISRIHRPKFVIRSHKPAEEIERLAGSLREDGQLEDIKVRPHPEIDGDYELVFGDCRLEGLALNEAKEVDAVVEELDDERVLLAQWAENENRLPLSEYDRGRWLRHMIEEHGYKQKALAERIGRPGKAGEHWVGRRLAILRLEKIVSRAILFQLSIRQSQAILNLGATEEELHELGREIEHYAKIHGGPPPSTQISMLFSEVRREFMRRQERQPVSEVKEQLGTLEVEPVKDFDDLSKRVERLRMRSSEAQNMIRPPLPERQGLSTVKARDVRQWCRMHRDQLEDIQRAVKYGLLFYAAYNRVMEPERAELLLGLPVNDEVIREVAFGLESKRPHRGSGEWNVLQQWNQIKDIDYSVDEPETVVQQADLGALEPQRSPEKPRGEAVAEPRGSVAPEQPAEEYAREYLVEHPEANLDIFVWEIAVAYGLSEAEAGELVRRIQREIHVERGDSRELPILCPLCKRHGADTKLIIRLTRDTRFSQMTLAEFVQDQAPEVTAG